MTKICSPFPELTELLNQKQQIAIGSLKVNGKEYKICKLEEIKWDHSSLIGRRLLGVILTICSLGLAFLYKPFCELFNKVKQINVSALIQNSQLSDTSSKVENFILQFDDGELTLPISEKQKLSKESFFFNQLFNGGFKEKSLSKIPIKETSIRYFEIMRSLIDQNRWTSNENFDIGEFIEIYQQALRLGMNSSIRIIVNELDGLIEGLGFADDQIDCVLEIQKSLKENYFLLDMTIHEYFLNYISTRKQSDNKIKYVILIKKSLKVEDTLNKACHDYFHNYILDNDNIPFDIADSLKEITQHINYFYYMENSVEDLEKIKTYYPNINKIIFANTKYINNKCLNLETICKNWPNLQELRFSDIIFKYNIEFKTLKSLTNLQKLTLNSGNITDEELKHLTLHPSLLELCISTSQDIINLSLKYFKSNTIKKLKVKRYKLTHEFFENIHSLSCMQELDLSDCKIQVEDIVSFKFPINLQKLFLKHWDFSGKSLDLTNCINLQDLNLSNCKNITGFGSFKFLDNLKTLDLSYCEITDKDLEDLKSFSNLQELNLSCCEKITDKGFENLKFFLSLKKLNLWGTQIKELGPLKLLSNLEELDLSDCNNITDDGIENIQSVSTLRKLNLKDCDNITGDSLEKLKSIAHLSVKY